MDRIPEGTGKPFAWIFETCKALIGVGPLVVMVKLPFKEPRGKPGTFSEGMLRRTLAVFPLSETKACPRDFGLAAMSPLISAALKESWRSVPGVGVVAGGGA